ncbi:hypothetical protein CDAR_97641 [Caerostris darwini]|uniref:Maturase K n=1 Tax=Caerostris darwini TaxID=1538125 RepID=A0AAV4NIP3_9ARAC|nr:hypothetical protein CDAR_97641 [Caerostris darwini]
MWNLNTGYSHVFPHPLFSRRVEGSLSLSPNFSKSDGRISLVAVFSQFYLGNQYLPYWSAVIEIRAGEIHREILLSRSYTSLLLHRRFLAELRVLTAAIAVFYLACLPASKSEELSRFQRLYCKYYHRHIFKRYPCYKSTRNKLLNCEVLIVLSLPATTTLKDSFEEHLQSLGRKEERKQNLHSAVFDQSIFSPQCHIGRPSLRYGKGDPSRNIA